jgi:hypothetical protein
MERAILFDHLPKAAGTSVRTYLLECFDEQEVINVGPDTDNANCSLAVYHLSDEVFNRTKCLMAHAANRWFHRFTNPFVTTVLREPVSRVISLYHFSRRTPDIGQMHLMSTQMDVVEFAKYFELGTSLQVYYNNTLQDYDLIGFHIELTKYCRRLSSICNLRQPYKPRYENAAPYGAYTRWQELSALHCLCATDQKFYKAAYSERNKHVNWLP